MIDDLTRSVLEQRDNIENQRNREIKSNEESYIKRLEQENNQLKEVIEEVREITKTAVPKNNGDYMMINFDNWRKLKEILDKAREEK